MNHKVVILGGAGLVGQNLVILLTREGFSNLVVVDKHAENLRVLQRLHPGVTTIQADIADAGDWEHALADATAAVMLQAHIGGLVEHQFQRDNVDSTHNVIAACRAHDVPYIVHISSSVVNSLAHDWYTESKKAQEAVVATSGISHVVLRPTLMFGWFDRKHLGWLSRFMKRVPIFPIPGNGRYLRQPLYVMDFCHIIHACLTRRITGAYDITGREEVDYVDIIRAIRREARARTWILFIPYSVFWMLLKVYSLIDRHPPFTTEQLKALVTPDKFELIPWWDIFSVTCTPFHTAIRETFAPGPYSDAELAF